MLKITVSLVASVITILAMRMAGRGDQRFNILGLINCGIWTFFTIITASWGLMLLNATLCYTYIQNLRRWRRCILEEELMEDESVKMVEGNLDAPYPPDAASPTVVRCHICGTITGEHGFSFDDRSGDGNVART